MLNIILPETNNIIPVILPTIIGAVIGIVGSLLIFFLNDKKETEKIKANNHQKHLAWLKGIKAEINHLIKVIDEIYKILEDQNVPSTKRLNYDYLQNARLKILEFDTDINFLEILTNAYRDIDHTNGMLDRLEQYGLNCPFIENVKGSLIGAKNSVLSLNKTVDNKLINI